MMNTKLHLFASALALALFAGDSQASLVFCNNYVASSPPPHYQCVQTNVGPGAPLVVSPDQAGSGLRVGESFSTGSGPFASASSAFASASPGLLRGFASAQMLGGSIPTASAVANSDAWFAAGGVVTGASGVATGTPVLLRFLIDVAGSFSGGGLFTALSEGTVDLVANGPGGLPFIHTHGHIDKYNPVGHVFVDTAASVGDTFEMIMKLHVSANATNEGGPANAMSVADVSNTSHLFVDVLSGNASFVGTDGHLYASQAVVPEPSTVPEPPVYSLLLLGLVLTAAFGRRRAEAQPATTSLI